MTWARDDWADEPAAPDIRLRAPRGGSGLWGEYAIGLSSGSIEGDLREFGGEPVVIFGYNGVDEMDPSVGGGWLQLLESGALEGEFMGTLGRFRAARKLAAAKTTQRPAHARGRSIRLR